jgi:serine/threonine protein kinase
MPARDRAKRARLETTVTDPMGTQTSAALPDGIEIGGYRILRKIASGGFSIVYLASDAHGQRFAIKEYLPAGLAHREPGALSPAIPDAKLGMFRQGLKAFFEEGLALARIVHPNVVRVANFFRANDTVYMVMAYERGRSLQDLVLHHRGRDGRAAIAERHIRRVFDPVLQGLREVHATRLLHLDLKPANVYLRRDGTPLLLDFGAARRALAQDAPALAPMFTPGFAAPELQARSAPLGPWTDVYGIGATLFACMLAAPPQPADQRQRDDRVDEALAGVAGAYSEDLRALVRACLSLDPMARPQSVFAVQRDLRACEADVPIDPEPSSGLGRWLDTVAGRLARLSRSEDDPTPPKA